MVRRRRVYEIRNLLFMLRIPRLDDIGTAITATGLGRIVDYAWLSVTTCAGHFRSASHNLYVRRDGDGAMR